MLRYLAHAYSESGATSANQVLAWRTYYDYNDYNDFAWEAVCIMGTLRWTVAEAKAKFSELINEARSTGPQTITRHGRAAAVIVAAEDWARRTKRKGSLAEFFAASPLRRSGLTIERLRGRIRKAGL